MIWEKGCSAAIIPTGATPAGYAHSASKKSSGNSSPLPTPQTRPSSLLSLSPLPRTPHLLPSAAGGGRSKIPFIPTAHRKKKNIPSAASGGGGGGGVFVLKRSKSVAPKPTEEAGVGIAEDSPRRKKRFWSFFYLSSSGATTARHCSRRSTEFPPKIKAADEESVSNIATTHSEKHDFYFPNEVIISEQVKKEPESPDSGSQTSSSFGRKVARSRSVGCGSRSFSGDFLERISTGLGDCTLRRVESHREPDKMVIPIRREGRIKDTRVKCGGIFGGLGMISSSYWLSAADVEDFGSTTRSRGRGWGWALGSPMRAFRPPVSGSKSTGGRIGNGDPSSLSVGGN